MDVKKIRELAFQYMANRKAHIDREIGFIYYHGQRVGNLSLKLRELLIPEDNSKDDIMVVGAFFHDVAKGIEPHTKYGEVLVKEILKGYCNEDELQEIVRIVTGHGLRGKSYENYDLPYYMRIVQDADILDHYGTIEVWLNFQYNAHRNTPMEESVKFYTYQYEDQVRQIRKILNYDISKKILDDKFEFHQEFVRRFAMEAQGNFVWKG